MYLAGTSEFEHHVQVYGEHRDFGYKDFIPEFRMEQFEPAEWAALMRAAGAQFVVPLAEHHDGFAMYDTERSRWSAVQMGPRRDVFGDLLEAVDAAWMVRGASWHRAEHWFFMNGGARSPPEARSTTSNEARCEPSPTCGKTTPPCRSPRGAGSRVTTTRLRKTSSRSSRTWSPRTATSC
ncbi:alpha-L-fucosidase [Microbacterium sp. LWH7-1.2]|uniref:alpha-L-fucosidase n=1 Tax=Microbacterium sp. LWH7-1.2 TaxID=3135257 RepID=UPI00313A2462